MSIKKKIIGLTLSMLLGSGVAVAAESIKFNWNQPKYSKAVKAFNSGNIQAGIAEFIPLAEQGDIQVQFQLARTL